MLKVEHMRGKRMHGLKRSLGVDQPAAVGIVSMLVLFFSDACDAQGSIAPHSPRALADALEYAGDADALYAALTQEHGYLILGSDGSLTFRDWHDYEPKWARDARLKRERRAAARTPEDTACHGAPSSAAASLCSALLSQEPSGDGACAPSGGGGVAAGAASPPAAGAGRSTDSQARRIRWSPEAGFTGITGEDRANWTKAYPAVDIDRQLAAMHAWLLANPREAPKSKFARFIIGWLSRNQDKGGDVRAERRRTLAPGIALPGSRALTREEQVDREAEAALRSLDDPTPSQGRGPPGLRLTGVAEANGAPALTPTPTPRPQEPRPRPSTGVVR